jgi:DNA-binding CsgD family transcriptional regulator
VEDLERLGDDLALWGFGSLIEIYRAAFLAVALLERGDSAGARQALAQAGDADVADLGIYHLLHARLELLVEDGDTGGAIAVAAEMERLAPYFGNPAVAPWRSLAAQALDRAGRHEEALARAAEEVGLARRWAAPWALGRSLRVLGALEREHGLDHLREAVDVLEGSPARLEHAKALAALGSAVRRLRKPTEARGPLRRALELADICGAAALAAHVRAELHAAGARPRTTALAGVEALTSSEKRVAALAADGGTNREIAQALFVTPKTVEVHLSAAYRKLGIRSRRELASALAPSS